MLPIIFTAILRDSILCIKKEGSLLALPLIFDGLLPGFLKHSFTT